MRLLATITAFGRVVGCDEAARILTMKGDVYETDPVVGGVVLALSVALGVLGGRMLSAQDPLKSGKELQRAELASAKGMEAILVLRERRPEERAASIPSPVMRCTSWRARSYSRCRGRPQ